VPGRLAVAARSKVPTAPGNLTVAARSWGQTVPVRMVPGRLAVGRKVPGRMTSPRVTALKAALVVGGDATSCWWELSVWSSCWS
jgi:hypothetical protein